MPKIPRYEESASLTAQVPNVMVRPTAVSLALEAAGGLAEAATAYDQAKVNLERVAKFASIVRESTKALQDLELEMAQYPDVWNAESYAEQRLQEIKQKFLEQIDDPVVQQKFSFYYDRMYITARGKIFRNIFSRKVDKTKAEILNTVQLMKDAFHNAQDEIEAKKILGVIDATIDMGAQTGVFDFSDAEVMKQKIREELKTEEILQDIRDNPDEALKRLEAGEYDVDPQSREQLIAHARAEIAYRLRQEGLQRREQERQAEELAFAKYVDGTLTPEDLIHLPMSRAAKMAFYNALVSQAKREAQIPSDPYLLVELWDKVDDGLVTKDVIVEAMNQKRLSPDDAIQLIKAINKKGTKDDISRDFWWKLTRDYAKQVFGAKTVVLPDGSMQFLFPTPENMKLYFDAMAEIRERAEKEKLRGKDIWEMGQDVIKAYFGRIVQKSMGPEDTIDPKGIFEKALEVLTSEEQ